MGTSASSVLPLDLSLVPREPRAVGFIANQGKTKRFLKITCKQPLLKRENSPPKAAYKARVVRYSSALLTEAAAALPAPGLICTRKRRGPTSTYLSERFPLRRCQPPQAASHRDASQLCSPRLTPPLATKRLGSAASERQARRERAPEPSTAPASPSGCSAAHIPVELLRPGRILTNAARGHAETAQQGRLCLAARQRAVRQLIPPSSGAEVVVVTRRDARGESTKSAEAGEHPWHLPRNEKRLCSAARFRRPRGRALAPNATGTFAPRACLRSLLYRTRRWTSSGTVLRKPSSGGLQGQACWHFSSLQGSTTTAPEATPAQRPGSHQTFWRHLPRRPEPWGFAGRGVNNPAEQPAAATALVQGSALSGEGKAEV